MSDILTDPRILPQVGERIRATQVVEGVIERFSQSIVTFGYVDTVIVREDGGSVLTLYTDRSTFEVLPEPEPKWLKGAVIRFTDSLNRKPVPHVAQFAVVMEGFWECTCGGRHYYDYVTSLWKQGKIKVLLTASTESGDDQ